MTAKDKHREDTKGNENPTEIKRGNYEVTTEIQTRRREEREDATDINTTNKKHDGNSNTTTRRHDDTTTR
jgi:hypothetical protein